MPKILPSEELDRIEKLIAQHPEGVRYRNELAEVIRAIVQDGLPTDEASILAGIPNSVSQEDKQKFVMLIQNELKSLHAGNAIRFGLCLLEFSVWQQKHQADCAE